MSFTKFFTPKFFRSAIQCKKVTPQSVCVRVRVCVWCVCACVYICVWAFVCIVCMCMYDVCVYLCLCVGIYVSVCTFLCVYLCVCCRDLQYRYGNISIHYLCIMIRYFEFHIVIYQLMCLHTKETREYCLVVFSYDSLMD